MIDEDHLHRLLREYVDHYNANRVHTELRVAPAGRLAQRRPSLKAEVSGLHHRYEWQDAA